ncbi:LLM class F420-dependent oxidoreductase [Gordonia insulae]|uniref:F420-dependent hydroxymycolic acid dehydrogenase n=1 Tax=Gordonia insulae TaxID=2420509 RepID=A0A3G8JMT6_9ACTN|nr:LLM class F420-dependent oxidoreductase [Gordonia insulae]AZG45769.1 F420-dependent hydroxymycolic acid dehydrogenase [Gordonia insulae]
MRFIYHYPETSGPDGDLFAAGALKDVAVRVEDAGFDAFSLSEHPAPGARWLASGGHQTLDPFVALGYVAAATERLRLLTYLAVAPYRNPLLLAKSAATLDTLSAGRLILGLGAGYQKSEFHALGVDITERNTLLDEALDVLPLHWSGEAFSYQGTHFSAREVMCRPRPTQSPIPIWIGGNSRLSRRRVARAGQGWMPMTGGAQLSSSARTPMLGSGEDLRGIITELRGAAEAAGRGAPIDVVYSYQADGITSPAVDADRHREAFAQLEESGVTWVLVSSGTSNHSATAEFLDAFGSTYLTATSTASG